MISPMMKYYFRNVCQAEKYTHVYANIVVFEFEFCDNMNGLIYDVGRRYDSLHYI